MQWIQKHQVALYLLALAMGALAALATGGATASLEPLILPALALLLAATFMMMPLQKVKAVPAFRGFLALLFGVNALLAPLVVLGLLSIFDSLDDITTFTVALVLLAPCIDYVVVFAGLAGADARKLLSATPALLLGQVVMIPVWLWVFGAVGLWSRVPWNLATVVDSAPDVAVALSAVIVPLMCAWGAQKLAVCGGNLARIEAASRKLSELFMMPLMMLVLFTSVAAHFYEVAGQWSLVTPALVYVVFALTMWVAGSLYVRWLGRSQHPDACRVVVFSGVTRNALVMMPVALALASTLPDAGVAARIPLVVVTQTLVELCVMVLMVRFFTGFLKKQYFS